jgi:hypothetical protein
LLLQAFGLHYGDWSGGDYAHGIQRNLGRHPLSGLPVSHSIFGLASLNAVEASLLCAIVAALIAIWGVVTQRIVARRRATLDYLVRIGTDNDLITARDKFAELTKIEGGLTQMGGAAVSGQCRSEFDPTCFE